MQFMELSIHPEFSPDRRKFLAKTAKIMKLSAFLLFVCCIQVSAKGFSQKITLSEKNSSVEKVFQQIEKQSQYHFVYAKEQVANMKTIDLTVVNIDLIEVLNRVFKNQDYTYTITGNYIVLKEKNSNLALEKIVLQLPPPFLVTGKIMDEDGNALSFASIILKSSKKGVASNNDGKFSIQVPEQGDILLS